MTHSTTLTVTVPDELTLEQIGPVPEHVRLIPWDLTYDLPDPSAVNVVLIPHYFFSKSGYERLATLPNLKMVQLPSAGYNHAEPYVPKGVLLCNGRGIHDDETAELAIGLALASLRGIDVAARDMLTHSWSNPIRPSLVDRKALIIGFGAIGREIAARLVAHKVEVTAIASHARTEQLAGEPLAVHGMAELEALLPTAEIVFLAVPLTELTTHLLDHTRLGLLPDGALVVNVARGPVVDTDALLAELTSERLRAALDVTDPEPLPADHPLWSAPGTLITPHCGGNTTATEIRTVRVMRKQIALLAAGHEPMNVVS